MAAASCVTRRAAPQQPKADRHCTATTLRKRTTRSSIRLIPPRKYECARVWPPKYTRTHSHGHSVNYYFLSLAKGKGKTTTTTTTSGRKRRGRCEKKYTRRLKTNTVHTTNQYTRVRMYVLCRVFLTSAMFFSFLPFSVFLSLSRSYTLRHPFFLFGCFFFRFLLFFLSFRLLLLHPPATPSRSHFEIALFSIVRAPLEGI